MITFLNFVCLHGILFWKTVTSDFWLLLLSSILSLCEWLFNCCWSLTNLLSNHRLTLCVFVCVCVFQQVVPASLWCLLFSGAMLSSHLSPADHNPINQLNGGWTCSRSDLQAAGRRWVDYCHPLWPQLQQHLLSLRVWTDPDPQVSCQRQEQALQSYSHDYLVWHNISVHLYMRPSQKVLRQRSITPAGVWC